MSNLSRRRLILLCAGLVTAAACAQRGDQLSASEPPLYPNETPELRRLINQYADLYEVPRPLVHRLAIRRKHASPGCNQPPLLRAVQILPQTARTMGFKGETSNLLDAETNRKQPEIPYAVRGWFPTAIPTARSSVAPAAILTRPSGAEC